MHLLPDIFKNFPEIKAAQSTRQGGVSAVPFDALNLSYRVGDAPGNVRENRRRFFGGLGFNENQIVAGRQVHDDKICFTNVAGDFDEHDAFITDTRGLILAVSVADCVPVLVFDKKNRAIAAIHAGWKGTAKRIVEKTLRKMTLEFGSRPEDCFAFIGTCIDECSYEVDADVADLFPADFQRFDPAKHKFFLDLKAANMSQLLDFGLPEMQIEVSPFSTFIDYDRFFSHRKSGGRTGRMMAAIGLI
ncbi:MAG TPA: peptidoglycan editing factor PgeF [Saprospiraceae bacterium]|nr:peptidoglycan editing factor PgeF [Saprospiraceae bacterium]